MDRVFVANRLLRDAAEYIPVLPEAEHGKHRRIPQMRY
jgi:hypothetical protein